MEKWELKSRIAVVAVLFLYQEVFAFSGEIANDARGGWVSASVYRKSVSQRPRSEVNSQTIMESVLGHSSLYPNGSC